MFRIHPTLLVIATMLYPVGAIAEVQGAQPYSIQRLLKRSTAPSVAERILYLSTGRRLPSIDPPKNIQVSNLDGLVEPDPLKRPVFRPTPITPPVPIFDPSGRASLSQRVLRRIEGFDPLIQRYSKVHALDANLIRAVIYVESAGKSDARSHKGAQGLMQLMPATAQDMGVSNPLDPAQNIYGGTRYLAKLLGEFKRPELALWGYNAGPESVKRRRLPLETKRYVPEVLRVKNLLDQQGT